MNKWNELNIKMNIPLPCFLIDSVLNYIKNNHINKFDPFKYDKNVPINIGKWGKFRYFLKWIF